MVLVFLKWHIQPEVELSLMISDLLSSMKIPPTSSFNSFLLSFVFIFFCFLIVIASTSPKPAGNHTILVCNLGFVFPFIFAIFARIFAVCCNYFFGVSTLGEVNRWVTAPANGNLTGAKPAKFDFIMYQI